MRPASRGANQSGVQPTLRTLVIPAECLLIQNCTKLSGASKLAIMSRHLDGLQHGRVDHCTVISDHLAEASGPVKHYFKYPGVLPQAVVFNTHSEMLELTSSTPIQRLLARKSIGKSPFSMRVLLRGVLAPARAQPLRASGTNASRRRPKRRSHVEKPTAASSTVASENTTSTSNSRGSWKSMPMTWMSM